jgi:hypothetical protein
MATSTHHRRHRAIGRVRDALDQLRLEHELILKMLRDFDNLRHTGEATPKAKGELVDHLCDLLSLHAQLKEQILYPVARTIVAGNDRAQAAFCNLDLLQDLIARVDEMEASDPAYDEAVGELGDCLVASMAAEQKVLFAEMRAAGVDTFALGEQMTRMRRAQQQRDLTRVDLPRHRSAPPLAGWPPSCRLTLAGR